MTRILILCALLAGCATTTPVDCRIPAPPDALLAVPPPLPPVPADLVPPSGEPRRQQ
jgi:hypothetical protein